MGEIIGVTCGRGRLGGGFMGVMLAHRRGRGPVDASIPEGQIDCIDGGFVGGVFVIGGGLAGERGVCTALLGGVGVWSVLCVW